MSLDTASITRVDLPYRNLLLTGFLGVGKTTIGRNISKRLGVDFFDLDEEIELRELMSIAKLRELYGDARLRTLEYDYCRQAALMRKVVLVIPGAALLDPRSFDALGEASQIVCLTCELGEALRRMHLASEQHYRDVNIRRRMLSRLRREYAVVNDPRLLQFDTTHLTIDEESDLLIRLWARGEPEGSCFHLGPRPAIEPPPRNPMGLSNPERGSSPPRSNRRF